MKNKEIINYLERECPFFLFQKSRSSKYFTITDPIMELELDCAIIKGKIYLDNIGIFNLLNFKLFLIMIKRLRDNKWESNYSIS